MKLLRRLGGILLWVLAAFGALAGAVWVGNALGLVQPLVVVSGSMSPAIRTGDLLIAVPIAASELEVGDVATLIDPRTNQRVTHRVISNSSSGEMSLIRMQGDANGTPDPSPYRVGPGDQVWHPVLTIPAGGIVVDRVARPSVALPLLLTLAAVLALSMLPERKTGRHVEEPVRRRPGKEQPT